jgi:hypothetical protein
LKNIIPKIVLSAVAVVVFGTIGVLVAVARPFHAPEDVGRLRKSLAGRATPGRSGGSALPVPPYTELTLSNSTRQGEFYRYESRLSVEGMWKFYTTELPRRGWERDARMDAGRARAGLSRPVLSFQDGRRRCIISVEETDTFTTAVTVLIVASGRRKAEKREEPNR